MEFILSSSSLVETVHRTPLFTRRSFGRVHQVW
uniref:Uncharacterized protein n=1 Tax=Solanum lycopersicum TaxID=4081 RepID=K4DDK2_SOLLC